MSEMRIGDAEREAAVGALGEHYAAGRLTKEEFDERSERAWTARTSSQLGPLFADLPTPHGRPSTTPATRVVGPATAPAARRHGFHPPFVPMVAIFVGVAVLTGHFWVFWVLLGLFWWSGRAFRAARRQRYAEQWAGWAGQQRGHRHGW